MFRLKSVNICTMRSFLAQWSLLTLLLAPLPLSAARIVVIGDSISDGYGVAENQRYTALLEDRARKEGYKLEIQNAAVSGSLSSSARSRIRWALKSKPDAILLQLGGNDALKATPPERIEEHLSAALEEARQAQVPVILAGMKIFGNYGASYARDFQEIFPRVAKKFKSPLIPYLLEGVGGDPRFNIADGIHPNAKGHERIADTVYPFLKPYLSKESN